ncbi:MAG: two component LuxR family transcriptional regulator [uncultured bacterium]|nr:MAG: two component LuxR family transcriptional regulator [uncultured bacterium]
MNMPISVVYVVDDDVSVCRSLSLLLKSNGYKVEVFNHSKDFLAFKRPAIPSCLILDVELPDINGLALQILMEQKKITIPIIFITGHGDIPMSVKGMKGGAVDFLTKPFNNKTLIKAITQAISNNKIQIKESSEISVILERISTLSPRELEVFQLVAQGMLSKQIAYQRGITLQTIKVHRGRVMQKMQAKTVTELIDFARKAGIISPQI